MLCDLWVWFIMIYPHLLGFVNIMGPNNWLLYYIYRYLKQIIVFD